MDRITVTSAKRRMIAIDLANAFTKAELEVAIRDLRTGFSSTCQCRSCGARRTVIEKLEMAREAQKAKL